MKLRLFQLRRIIREDAVDDSTTNFNEFLPADHELGMRVTKGGSMCANCRWVSDDEKRCGNERFRAWQEDVKGADDGSELPAPSREYCCDLWQPG